jgi:hypothetical protein
LYHVRDARLRSYKERFSLQTRSRRAASTKPGGLAVVGSLRQSVVEEGILDVELMNRLVPGEGEGEDGSHGGKLGDEVDGLVVVHTGALGEAPKDPTGLVAVNGAV